MIEPNVMLERVPGPWRYSSDGATATLAAEGASAALLGATPSDREPVPEDMSRFEGFEHWMTTLRFELRSARFSCRFDVERQHTTDDPRPTEELVPSTIVWKLDYNAILVTLGGGTPQPVAELSRDDWVDLDRLLVTLLQGWPVRPDEERWRNASGRVSRGRLVLGGWLGDTWASGFARRHGGNVRLTDDEMRSRQVPMPADAAALGHGWRFPPGETPQIANDTTATSLAYLGSHAGSPFFSPGFERDDVIQPTWVLTYKLLQFDQAGDRLTLLAASHPVHPNLAYWNIDLGASLLVSSGWSIEDAAYRIGAEEELRARQAALDRLAPTPRETSLLINAILDASLHWPRTGEAGLLPPILVSAHVLFSEPALRYEAMAAVPDARLLPLFDHLKRRPIRRPIPRRPT